MFRIRQGWIVTTAHTSQPKMLRACPATHRPMRSQIRRRRAMTSLPMIRRILTKRQWPTGIDSERGNASDVSAVSTNAGGRGVVKGPRFPYSRTAARRVPHPTSIGETVSTSWSPTSWMRPIFGVW